VCTFNVYTRLSPARLALISSELLKTQSKHWLEALELYTPDERSGVHFHRSASGAHNSFKE